MKRRGVVVLPRVVRYPPVEPALLVGLLAQVVHPVLVRVEFIQELLYLNQEQNVQINYILLNNHLNHVELAVHQFLHIIDN